jgi:uroporphyrinogen-III synthase
MKTILYLGTDPERYLQDKKDVRLIHYPVIAIIPRALDHPEVASAYRDLFHYTHLLFTSKNAVRVFFDHLSLLNGDLDQLSLKTLIAIGTTTARAMSCHLRSPDLTPEHETQEGLIELLKQSALDGAYFLLPRSSLSRPILLRFFQERKIRFAACDLYDTVTQKLEPVPDLKTIDEIVFTSPSTVRGFLEIFGDLPKDKRLHAIGPITAQALQEKCLAKKNGI